MAKMIKPEVDETLYFLKVSILDLETLIRDFEEGKGELGKIKEKSASIFEGVQNLQTILKSDDSI